MKPQGKLYHKCLKLHQTSENVGYCGYYGEIRTFCPETCPFNYSTPYWNPADSTKGGFPREVVD